MTKSESLLVDNKIYAKNIVSDHNILDFVICENNDLLSPEYVVTKGKDKNYQIIDLNR